jgi:hypothetical protein
VRQAQTVSRCRPVQPPLAISAVAGEPWLRLAAYDPAVLLGRTEVNGEVRRALECLPGDDARFVPVSQAAARTGLNVGKDRKEGKARAFERRRRGEEAVADRDDRQRGDASRGAEKGTPTEHSDKGVRFCSTPRVD